MLNDSATGIYLAYPRTEESRVDREGQWTLVNCKHTKVGFAAHSFRASSAQYRRDFDGNVKFMPLAEVPAQDLAEVEQALISKLSSRFPRVSCAANWFVTQDRQSIISMIYAQLTEASRDTAATGGEIVEETG